MDIANLTDIKNYEGKYKISEDGRVYSCKRNRFLKSYQTRFGYPAIKLEGKGKYIHRLVAETLIPNSEDKPEVNHINHIKTDNRKENLEWVSRNENVRKTYENKERKRCSKAVNQLDLEGNILNTFSSVREAANYVKRCAVGLTRALRNPNYTCGGFKWGYVQKCVDIEPHMKPIEGYENYKIMGEGRIYNTKNKMWLKERIDNKGYKHVKLSKNCNANSFQIHVLVNTIFNGPKPFPNYVVNHKDGNPSNNHFSNLEWVSRSRNTEHAYDIGLRKRKKVEQYDFENNFIQTYESIKEVLEMNPTFSRFGIYKNCRRKSKSSSGFIWKYSQIRELLV